MNAWGLVEYALESTAVLLICCAIAWRLRNRSASIRHAVWSAGLATVLILVPLGFVTPTFTVPLLSPAPAASAGVDSPVPRYRGGDRTSSDFRASQALRASSLEHVGRIPTPALTATLRWMGVVASWAWLMGSALLLCRIVQSRIRLGHLRRRASPIRDSRVLKMVDEVRRVMRLSSPLDLRWSRQVRTPVAFGALRATVMLPCEASAWSTDRLRVVITHELSHIQRRDPLTQMVAELARAVHWYNPIVWYAVGRSMLERERACDDLVVMGGVPGIECAEHLISMAKRLTHGRAFPRGALTMAEGNLEARVTSLLSSASRREPLTRMQFCVVAFPAVLAIAVLAAIGVRPGVADSHGSQTSFLASSAARSLDTRGIGIAARPPSTHAPDSFRTSESSSVSEPSGATASPIDAAAITDAAADHAQASALANGTPLSDPASEQVAVRNPRERWPSDREIQSSPERDFLLRLRAGADHEKSWEYDLVRERSEWALTRVRDGRIVAPLVESLADPDWRIQAYAAWALAAIGASGASATIRPLLDHSNWRVRAQATSSLQLLGSDVPLETLRRLSGDEAWQVRMTVVELLQNLGGAEAREALERMRNDPHSGTRMQVEAALEMLAGR